VRALGRLVDEGLVGHIGLANVNRQKLDEALEQAPITAVQVALSPFDDAAIRGGVLERASETGIAVIAHSPLGGPRRASRLARHAGLSSVAEAHGVTPAQVALAWLLALSPNVVPIPGARHPETARSAAEAPTIQLDASERELLAASLGGARPARARSSRSHRTKTDVVIVMGVPGAGKTRTAQDLSARGYLRLNRDERGGSLRELAAELDDALSSGTGRVVLDNTYLTRASRSYVIETGNRHGVPVRCVWLDIPLAQAQVNVVERLLERFGALPTPEQLQSSSRTEPGVHTPTTQMRTFRELEPPTLDEGFVEVEHVTFARTQPARGHRAGGGVFVGAAALVRGGWEEALEQADPSAPHLIFDWSPHGSPAELQRLAESVRARVEGSIESSLCPHPAGPPICWCRPPLPGLPLAFAFAHGVDPARSLLVGASPAHKTLATTLGARYLEV